jgi:hypothetical protein
MNLMDESGKIMFEIYRGPGSAGDFRVVYYTELSPRNRDFMINQALSGESVFNGFLDSAGRIEAGREVEAILEELNSGDMLDRDTIRRRLAPFLVP